MRQLLFSMAFILGGLTLSYAQAQTALPNIGEISGRLVDSASKQPLDYATVSLMASSSNVPVAGVLTDASGSFKFSGLKFGVYVLKASYMGYRDRITGSFEVSASAAALKTGDIMLAATGETLNAVVIVGQTALVENKIDKLVYNAEKDITASGGTAVDVLGKVPMVSVDLNGNVSVRGDQNVRVLINGKSTGSATANVSDVLRSIPSDQIKNIEVITSPSAKYDAEGSAGIINIVTKKKNVSGISGSINGGLGSRQNNENFNVNYNNSKFRVTANVGGFFSWPQRTINTFDQRIENDSINTRTLTEGISTTQRGSINSSVTAGYDLDTLNTISSTFRLMRFFFNNDGASNTMSATPYDFTSDGRNAWGNFDLSLDYTRKFNRKDEELNFSTQWSHGIGENDYTNIYTAVFSDLRNNIQGKNNEYTFQLDYTLPFGKIYKLETGAKSILRRLNSTSDYYNDITGNGFVFDPVNSNVYRYNQNVIAAYSVLTMNLAERWSILAGLRNEMTTIQGDPENSSQNLSPFSQDYNTLIPSLTIQRKLKGANTLKILYSKRIARPGLQFLNPFTNQSSPQNQTVGNPVLRPEVSHTFEADYNVFWGSNSITAGLYYRRTNGLIEGIAQPISVFIDGVTQGGTLTTFQNIGSNNSIGSNLFVSLSPIKIFNISANINSYTYNPNPTGIYSNSINQRKTYILYNGFIRGTLTLPKDLIFEANLFGGSARRTIQGTNPSFLLNQFGIRKQFNNKTMSVGVNALQPFKKYIFFRTDIASPGFEQRNDVKLPVQSFGLTFSYNFGKLNFDAPQKRKGINNDDQKQGEQGQ